MGIVPWIILFLVLTVVCAWVVLGNGAESFAGLLAAALLGADILRWSETGIRLFAGLTWLVIMIWFVIGLFDPR